jgi:hypothetical protein
MATPEVTQPHPVWVLNKKKDKFSNVIVHGKNFDNTSKVTVKVPNDEWAPQNERPFAGGLLLFVKLKRLKEAEKDQFDDLEQLTIVVTNMVGGGSGDAHVPYYPVNEA